MPGQVSAQPDQWLTANGDAGAQKYSPANQISPQNVRRLKRAWTVHTGDVSRGREDGTSYHTAWSSTPLFVNNMLYVSTPTSKVFSVQPDTGKVDWIYDAHPDLAHAGIVKSRGLAYWRASQPASGQPCQKILYVGTEDSKLHAIDADTGKPCRTFGKGGTLDINQWNTVNPSLPLLIRQPPAVYGDTLIIGWACEDLAYEKSPPGTVFGVDARTGQLKWTFQIMPDSVRKRIGTANIWAGMSVDPKSGLVYLPVSSPEANFYGGDRKEPIPIATSVTALNADTGELVWSRQLVHHDIWDYDTDSPPTLIDIQKDGMTIPALVQSTKQGFLYVLNRLTGEPVYPMPEHKVPASDVPGEKPSPTQPWVDLPAPTVADRFPGIFPLADMLSLGFCSRAYAKLRDDGKFTPPSLQGSIAFPGKVGGVEWGGGAVDPATQTYVVNSNDVVQVYKLIPRKQYEAARKAGRKLGSPQRGAPYAVQTYPFLNPLGMPCWKPPYGTLSSYDLKTGKLLWREPFGQVQQWGFYMPESWGSVTLGPPIITASGLIFIGASMDSRARALDLKTGKVLWKAQLDAPAVSSPATYVYKGKQYVVFVAGGNPILMPKLGDELVAFALPN
ncbi:MAG: pyrroloquinoline quinone-dependent dehydrogenase [Alphaproteobacteria bacterium]|nr:pyrroloquinoline quinone-dependent dehydrogenase [Alphaproteobacteria bacterium]